VTYLLWPLTLKYTSLTMMYKKIKVQGGAPPWGIGGCLIEGRGWREERTPRCGLWTTRKVETARGHGRSLFPRSLARPPPLSRRSDRTPFPLRRRAAPVHRSPCALPGRKREPPALDPLVSAAAARHERRRPPTHPPPSPRPHRPGKRQRPQGAPPGPLEAEQPRRCRPAALALEDPSTSASAKHVRFSRRLRPSLSRAPRRPDANGTELQVPARASRLARFLAVERVSQPTRYRSPSIPSPLPLPLDRRA